MKSTLKLDLNYSALMPVIHYGKWASNLGVKWALAWLLVGWVLVLSGAVANQAAVIKLTAAADTFIANDVPDNNGGGTPWFTVGSTGRDGDLADRRGMLRFDLSRIPAGSTITSVVLELTNTRVPKEQAKDSDFDLWRLLVGWGEGNKIGTEGAPATAGEATWNARMLGSANWTEPGATNDTLATPSATTRVGAILSKKYTWTGPGMVNDAQFWLDNPAQNFGWLMTSRGEDQRRTARGFGSREDPVPANAGTLEVGYISSGISSNAPPLITLTNLNPIETVFEGALLTFKATATDPDIPAQALTFSLENGTPSGASITSDGTFTWTPSEAQGPSTNRITVRVTDNGTPPLSDTKSLTVVVSESNLAPVLAAIPDQTAKVNQAIVLSFTATDGDMPVQQCTYSLVQELTGATVDAQSGQFTWTPAPELAGTVQQVTVKVTDNGSPALSDTKSFAIAVNNLSALVWTPILEQRMDELTELSLTNLVTDPDQLNRALTYSLEVSPSGMTLDPSTGLIHWTPTEAQGPSTNQIKVKATDNGSPLRTVVGEFNIVVNEVNRAPVLDPIANQVISAGGSLLVNITGKDTDMPEQTLTYNLVESPTGAVIGATDGVVSWLPSPAQAPSTNRFIVTVTDNGNPALSVTNQFEVVVTKPPSQPIRIDPTQIRMTQAGFQVEFPGVPGQTCQIEYSTDLKAWQVLREMTLETATGVFTDETTPSQPYRFYRIVVLD